MTNKSLTAPTGRLSPFIPGYETRTIILAQGIEGHDEELDIPPFKFLKRKLGRDFKIESNDRYAEYISHGQHVHFLINIVRSKVAFKNALETPDAHVIYGDHSRWGRGACFAVYSGQAKQRGDQWENGRNDDDGLYRLGYPFIPIELAEIKHHQYHFAPVPAEWPEPANERRHPYSRHPHARRRLQIIKLPRRPFNFRNYVMDGYRSKTNRYYGFIKKGRPFELLLHAGWQKTQSHPYELNTTSMVCKVFCHFGCSSRLHFSNIVNNDYYAGPEWPYWGIERYSFFTDRPSDERVTRWWLYYLLKYDKKNNFESWHKSLQYARINTNNLLRSKRAGYLIY